MQYLLPFPLIRSFSSRVSSSKYAYNGFCFSIATLRLNLSRPKMVSTTFFSTKFNSPYHLPSNIIFRQTELPVSESQPRSLVLFFAWTLAKEAHLEKFRNLWFSRGYDVLTVQTAFTELALPQTLLPRHSRANANQILKFLNHQKAEYSYERIVLQGCSFGVYNLFTFIDQLEKSIQAGNTQSLSLQRALKALILDSGVVAKEVQTGIAHTVFKNTILRILFKNATLLYYTLTYPLTRRNFLKIGAIVEENSLRLPALILHSLDDEIAYYRFLDELIHLWKEKDILVASKCWKSSGHVMHFKNYPEEYSAQIDAFLEQMYNKK